MISSELRYVAFGKSITWGFKIDREREAYIKLLSSEGVNLGIRGSDPSYPALCTQSMVGDSIFDVIIIEYNYSYRCGLSILARRLRKRFPNAIIIIALIWSPRMLSIESQGTRKYFLEWLQNRGLYKGNRDRALIQYSNITTLIELIKKTGDEDFNQFSFIDDQFEIRQAYMRKMEQDYNVKLYKWETQGDMKQIMLEHLPFFHNDLLHLTAEGHKKVADEIQKIVVAERAKPSNRIGLWEGGGEICYQWILNGLIKKDNFKFFPKRALKKFDSGKGYYALHLDYATRLRFYNPFNEERQLALSYMVTGPDPEDKLYPMLEIHLNGSPSMMINPFTKFYRFPVHVQKTQIIGSIKPGANVVDLEIIEKSKYPFRLIGFAMTSGGTVNETHIFVPEDLPTS